MKKHYIALTLAVITASSLLMTACGNNKNDTVSAMNNVSTETESIAESSTEIESSIETESTTEIETQDATESTIETETQDATESITDTSSSTYTTTPTTGTMYATTDAYTYDGPSIEGYEIKATVQKDEEIRVIGKVNEANWYEIEQEGEIRSFISADFLTTTAPNPAPATSTTSTPQTAQNTQQQPQQTQTPQQVQETTQPETPVEEYSEPPEEYKPGNPVYSVETTPPVLINGEWRSPDGVALINPNTGDYYKAGDIMPDGKSIYAGGFDSSIGW